MMAEKGKGGKAKMKKTKETGPSDDHSNGDVLRGKSSKAKAKTTEKSQRGQKKTKHQKMKSPKKENTDFEIADDTRFQLNVKEEADDGDFVTEKKGAKRKRDSATCPSSSSALFVPVKKKKVEAEDEGSSGVEKKKIKRESKEQKVKKEEGELPVTKKKRTKEEIAAARALKIKKKEEEEQQRWRWWEEEKYEDGIKWKFLEHKGPYFPPEYQPLPDNVKFFYDGKAVKLSLAAEEVALFFAQMLDHEYTTKEVFRNNFLKDWRKEMTLEERMLITDLNKCDFGELHAMHKQKVEARKNLSKEEKQINKEANQKILEEFGYCMLDHHRERIGNFKIEPPGLFRGRGDHPKQGMLKKRIQPEDVIINCSRNSHIPEPPTGHKWKEVRHDNTVTWLASWTENVQGSCKYVMLNANSKLKGEKDWEKYEVARKLKSCVDAIRSQYQEDLKSKQMGTRQRAVALYFIDKLALRAGNEKEEGETADTVGCCSLRVEHITLHDALDGETCVVEFDFLGKDCIRYYNKVPVSKRVFKNLKLFMENKQEGDDLFDRLNTNMLNKHLTSLMPGLTAKVFRTYNASITLQQQLKGLSNSSDNVAEKLLSYNRANRAVAVLCNHQRAPPKTFEQSMASLQAKIESRKEQLELAKKELKLAKKEAKGSSDSKLLVMLEKKKKTVQRCEEQLLKMEVQATDREENKQIALSTSKLNYLDPRISVAWCKNMEVPLDKVYNKTLRDKFAWAIDMTEPDFVF
ncbi:DNA topoisomerase I, mitochondrial isoform X1 [Pygocentrus nattereri]|uniref:DNA topoisomerase I n=2 Tax=Pygocentrus nattereri TaxID=42514 RepID=A0A3B4E8Q8_PYGNA|nr:DNA topoisomerase I, mitochondrial isoform X1 [Pygocentrus nattereri]XP_017544302.1 DNA topoisomerase I, mitochondrial isoform X1 [Pygocentrus nattereri]XP_017544363.1 DNA topoisomerase I, mitochondrial isoform X1 [Pygocentrus nattereri]XP_017544423.1 DNA topoisomerase I, mitochondrial isoform X1 [Pygocentrus nattereri]